MNNAAGNIGGTPQVPDIVIITGMSGAGRSTAAKSLEDLDWFVVDNLPPGLLATMADLAERGQGAVPRIAVVVDVRVTREENVYPMIPAGQAARDMVG